jgi:hypothetical protein
MKKLDKKQLEEKKELVTKLGLAKTAIEEALAAYEELREEAQEFVDNCASDMSDYYDERSEEWQEGDVGSTYSEWMEQWQDLTLVEIDLSDELETIDSFDELPVAPGE